MSTNDQADSSRLTAASALTIMHRADSLPSVNAASPLPIDDAGERDAANKSSEGSTSLPAHASSNTSATDEAKAEAGSEGDKALNLEVPMTFPQRLMEILSDKACKDIISWLPHGRGFIIYQKRKFASDVLPRYFKQSKFTSFTRKLNRWGFTRVTRGPETGAYYHEYFQRNNHRLCMQMACISGIKSNAKVSTAAAPLGGLEGLSALNGAGISAAEAQVAAATEQAQQDLLTMQALVKAQNEALRQALMGAAAAGQQQQRQRQQAQIPPQLAVAAMNAMCPGSSLSMGHSPAAIAAAINNVHQVGQASYLSNLRDKQAALASLAAGQHQTPTASAAASLQTRSMLEQLARERRVLAAAGTQAQQSSSTFERPAASSQQQRRLAPGKSYRASAA